ncbi:hypothetical protein [Halobacterium sp. CBA1126]|uniref:hypothetical protein n=1 Tax=Halobacterium TaxID=2239 RepID=UPI0012FBA99E|nr:hypothetical protein [Halobacterium sp. CBA1126]MUV60843.1 hypothetical protein [Halobacterium sp. CBA1126]
MTDGSEDKPSDRMRERVPRNSRWFWVVLDADRRAVAGGLLVVLFCSMVVAGTLLPTPAYALLTDGDPHETLFNALVGSTITGVTLVLTLSQLVLSQELGAVGDQRDRMEGAMEFREDAANAAGMDVAPTEPSAFLRGLVAATREQADALADAAPDGETGDAVQRYVDNLTGNARAVTDQLEGAQFGDFDVVWAALNYNYSWKIYAGERLRSEHGDALGEDADDALSDLLDTLALFGPAREHFKTLYFQWELSDLSRTLLYAAVPALAVSIVAVLLLDPSAHPGSTLGVSHALVLVSASATVAVLPFTILLAYILRIVTVTKRTLSIGPFILRETERSGDVDN